MAETKFHPVEERVANLENLDTTGCNLKVYKKRWFLLSLVIFYELATGIHWLQLSVITNIVSKFYNVSPILVEWTTIMMPIILSVLILPCSYLLRKIGLRYFIIISASSGFVGTLMKIYASENDRFWLIVIGQFFNGIPFAFTYCLVAYFVAIWFPNHEISKACAIVLMGSQLGWAFSFLIPNVLVQDHNDHDLIQKDLWWMQCIYAVLVFSSMILLIIFFENEPQFPPSKAQELRGTKLDFGVTESIIKALKNPSFLIVSAPYAMNTASYQIFSTYLNKFVFNNFNENVDKTGQIGCLSAIAGMIGSFTFGIILDKYKIFKETSMCLITGACFSFMLMAMTLKQDNIIYFYGATSFIGFFTMAMHATGSQLGIEITYPLPEEIVFSIMQIFGQIMGTLFSILFGILLRYISDSNCIIILILFQLVGIFLSCSAPSKLQRQCVEQTADLDELGELILVNSDKRQNISTIEIY